MPENDTHMADSSSASPGAILKRCRIYHEISLEEAEESTKIGASYLRALEEDQIDQFASLAYLKGFLRIYAVYLGLNPDDMIRLYEKLYTSKSGGVGDKTGATGSGDQPPRRKFRFRIPFQKLAMPGVLLLLILITAAIINRPPSPVIRPHQTVPVMQTAVAPIIQQQHSAARQILPVKKGDDAMIEKVQSDSTPALQPGMQKPAPETTRGVIVRLKVNQGGALTVTIDDSTSQLYNLEVGDSIVWKADRTITLELSNAGGVEAELNGRPLKPLGPTGKPAVVVLDAEGIRP